MKFRIYFFFLFLIKAQSSFSQNAYLTLGYADLKCTEDWKVFFNQSTEPLQLYQDSSLIIHITNPATDRLTFVRTNGKPLKGKIRFVNAKGVPTEFPFPIAKYRLNQPVVVELKNIAKNYRKHAINGLDIQFLELRDGMMWPIIQIKFKSQ